MRAQREQAEQVRSRAVVPGFPVATPPAQQPGADLNRAGGFFPAPAVPGAAQGGGFPAARVPPAFPGAQIAPLALPQQPAPGAATTDPAPVMPGYGPVRAGPAPASATGAGTGQATAAPTAPAAAAVLPPDPSTQRIPRGDRRGADPARTPNDGTRTVITQTVGPDGSQRVMGYRQIEDGRNGTTTRIYGDGRRVVWGPDFERRSIGNGVGFVTRHDGRREATLPDGRPIFHDRYIPARDTAGAQRQQIERTRYVRWWRGRPVFDSRPLVRYYDAGYFHGAPVAYYRPQRLAPRYHGIYVSPIVVPVPITAFGPVDEWVIFASSPQVYHDPAVLMGDMQIWSGFEQGFAYSSVWPGTGLSSALSARGMAAQPQQQMWGFDPKDAARHGYQQPANLAAPVAVSEEIRLRVREQVRATVALLNAGSPLTLGHVLAAPDVAAYLFQTAQPLMVPDLSGGGECFLNTGDLIRFFAPPDDVSGFATMTVVASAPNSCSPGSVVPVSLGELQEMLNGFVERLEDNLQRVEACNATGAC